MSPGNVRSSSRRLRRAWPWIFLVLASTALVFVGLEYLSRYPAADERPGQASLDEPVTEP